MDPAATMDPPTSAPVVLMKFHRVMDSAFFLKAISDNVGKNDVTGYFRSILYGGKKS